MRAAAGVVLLLLAACSAGQPAPDPDSLIECALGGATSFTRACAVEHEAGVHAVGVTVRHPDGTFRRLTIHDDGSGIETADGADPAVVSLREDGTEVAVGPDRYRFAGRLAFDDGR